MNVPTTLPLLSEGATYRLEIVSEERVRKAVFSHTVDDAPLGRGFSFLIGKRRQFIYERDLRPGPAGMLIAHI